MNERDVHVHETGGSGPEETTKKVVFDKYEVTVSLGPRNEFLGILQIAVRKAFLSGEQKRQTTGSFDVTDLYEK